MVAALIASASLVGTGVASADVPSYTCDSTPAVYRVPTQGDLGGVAAGDLDGDGSADVATANLASSSSIFLNTGQGSLAPPRTFSLADANSSADGAQSPILVDANGDGRLDVVTADYYGNGVSVLLGRGKPGRFGPATTYPVEGNPFQVVAGDFDGDGSVDLVVGIANSPNALALLRGNGDGSFARAKAFRVPISVDRLVAGDFNGDGRPDLAAAANGRNENSVVVLLNTGQGKFGMRRVYPVGNDPVGLAQGDVNGDGHPDLVSANITDNTFSVLLNKGDGSGFFNPAVPYTGGGGQLDVILADVSGDGQLDIVAGNPFGNNIMVLPNQGAGTFGAPIICPNAPTGARVRGPLYVAAADFDNDGTVDIVTANLHSGNEAPTISVLITPHGSSGP